MDLKKIIFTENPCYKAGKTMTPTGIMVHSTAVNNPDLKRYVGPDDGMLGYNQHQNHWNQNVADKCVHAFIGKLANGNIATYQTLPWDMRGWHAGGAANNNYISFEICEAKLDDKVYFDKVYKEAVELTAMLCKLYNIKPEIPFVICHSEGYERGIASNSKDVMHLFPIHNKNMDTFRADVAKEINYVPIPEFPLLKKGDNSEIVKAMQIKLNEFGYNLTTDGIFGQLTENALKDFQSKNGLTIDGKCGTNTWAALNNPKIYTKTPEEITVENAVNDGVITNANYWLEVLYGNITVSKENLKGLIDAYHAKNIIA